MKRLLLCLLLFASVPLSGCSAPPYKEVGIQRGTSQITCYVVIPDGASTSDMTSWGKELEQRKGHGETPVQVVFYKGSRATENIAGVYSGGVVIQK